MSDQGCKWLDDHPEAIGEAVPPAHLATRQECRAQVDALERVLRRGLAAPDVPVPPELAHRIEEAVEARYGRAGKARSRSWILAATVAAAVLVAAVAGGAVLATRRSGRLDRVAKEPLLSSASTTAEPPDAGPVRRRVRLPGSDPDSPPRR